MQGGQRGATGAEGKQLCWLLNAACKQATACPAQEHHRRRCPRLLTPRPPLQVGPGRAAAAAEPRRRRRRLPRLHLLPPLGPLHPAVQPQGHQGHRGAGFLMRDLLVGGRMWHARCRVLEGRVGSRSAVQHAPPPPPHTHTHPTTTTTSTPPPHPPPPPRPSLYHLYLQRRPCHCALLPAAEVQPVAGQGAGRGPLQPAVLPAGLPRRWGGGGGGGGEGGGGAHAQMRGCMTSS